MPARSLLEMCQRKGKRNSQNLEHLGDYRISYRIARPILRTIKSPDQLRRIEEKSPQILGETGELWLDFIKRDIPDWQNRKHEPANPENWWKVYRKLKNDVDAEEAARIEGLQANLRDKNAKALAEIKPRTAFEFKPTLKQKWAEEYFTGKKIISKSKKKLGVLEKIKKDVKAARSAAERQHQQLPRTNFPTTVARPPPQFVEDIKKREDLAALRSPKKPVSTFVSATDAGMRQDTTARKSPSKAASNPPSRPSIIASSSQSVASQRSTQNRDARALTSQNPLPSHRTQVPLQQRSPLQAARPTNPARNTSVFAFAPTRAPAPGLASASTSASVPSAAPASRRGTISNEDLEEVIRLDNEKHSPAPSNPSSRPGSSNSSQSGGSPQMLPMVRKRRNEPDVFLPPAKKRFVPASRAKVNRS